jgi:ribosomal protein L6P/L9E
MPKEVTINITEVTVVSGKKKSIKVNIDGHDVHIPVDEGVYAYFQDQFSRVNPTQLQRKKFGTVMNLLRAAYIKGVSDGKNA